MDDEDEWLRELLSRRPVASAASAAGVASAPCPSASGSSPNVPSPRPFVIYDSVVLPHRPLSTIVPPTMVQIVRERVAREAAQEKQDERNQQARWDIALKVRRPLSPFRCEHRISLTDSQRCSSRSRSPGVCEELGRQETLGVGGVSWEYYCPERDPPRDIILAKSEAAIRATYFPPSMMGPRFYVGVSRYLHRRWFGHAYMNGHRSRWRVMHILGFYSSNAGQAEDTLIKTLKKRYDECCANRRGGGGSCSSRRPSFLNLCIHSQA